MRKITAIFLSVLMIMCMFGCGDGENDEPISRELELDIANESLYGMTLGMSFKEFIQADIIEKDDLTADGIMQEWEYYDVGGISAGKLTLCGYPVDLQTFYKGDKLYHIGMNAFIDVGKLSDDEVEKAFGEAAGSIEKAVSETAGDPHIELREARSGEVSAENEDDVTLIYFVKDGKVIEGEIPFTGTSEDLMQVYRETDYDYALVYTANKPKIPVNRTNNKSSYKTIVSVGLYTKEAIVEYYDRVNYFQTKFEELAAKGTVVKPGIDMVLDYVFD